MVRRARDDEGPYLSELALRSKALWGYDNEFLEACRTELEITGEYIRSSEVFVLELSGAVVGFCTFFGELPDAILDFLYVDPRFIGQGHGKTLWRHAVGHARDMGYQHFTIDCDPHAEPFYLRMGAERLGEVPSGSIPGRMLPQFKYEIIGSGKK